MWGTTSALVRDLNSFLLTVREVFLKFVNLMTFRSRSSSKGVLIFVSDSIWTIVYSKMKQN